MRLLLGLFFARLFNTLQWKVERYVAYLPWINEVFSTRLLSLGVWLLLAPIIFRSYQEVLGSYIRRNRHRYHEQFYEDEDSVIAIRFQRGSLSTRFFFCQFPLFRANPLLCLLPWNIELTLWVSSRCQSIWNWVSTVPRDRPASCHKEVILCRRLEVRYHSSLSQLFYFVDIDCTLFPPRQSFLIFSAIQCVVQLWFVYRLRLGGGDYC